MKRTNAAVFIGMIVLLTAGCGKSPLNTIVNNPFPLPPGTIYELTPIDNIENALVLVATDLSDDYADPGEGYPPTGVVSYPPVDLQKVYMGVYNGRLYIKFVLGGVIPEKQEVFQGGTIKELEYGAAIDANNNGDDGRFGSETSFSFGFKYTANSITPLAGYFANFIDMSVEDGKFEKTGNGILHAGNGGPGKNYFIVSYALSDLLDTVYVGQNIRFQFAIEAGSDEYKHFSYDEHPNTAHTWVSWTVQEIQP